MVVVSRTARPLSWSARVCERNTYIDEDCGEGYMVVVRGGLVRGRGVQDETCEDRAVEGSECGEQTLQKHYSRSALGAPGEWRNESVRLEWKREKTDKIRAVRQGPCGPG